MEPTIAEIIFWCALGAVALSAFIIGAILNPNYDPKADDPYKYCPKEEE